MLSRRGFVTADFYFKSPARIKKAACQSTWKIKIIQTITRKSKIVGHLKISKINTTHSKYLKNSNVLATAAGACLLLQNTNTINITKENVRKFHHEISWFWFLASFEDQASKTSIRDCRLWFDNPREDWSNYFDRSRKHSNQPTADGNLRKVTRMKIININRADGAPKCWWNSTFTKHYYNLCKINGNIHVEPSEA